MQELSNIIEPSAALADQAAEGLLYVSSSELGVRGQTTGESDPLDKVSPEDGPLGRNVSGPGRGEGRRNKETDGTADRAKRGIGREDDDTEPSLLELLNSSHDGKASQIRKADHNHGLKLSRLR